MDSTSPELKNLCNLPATVFGSQRGYGICHCRTLSGPACMTNMWDAFLEWGVTSAGAPQVVTQENRCHEHKGAKVSLPLQGKDEVQKGNMGHGYLQPLAQTT